MLKEKSELEKLFPWLASVVIITAIFFLKFAPLQLTPMGGNLDGSWRSALAYAAENHMRFGTDVVFTGGPLSGIFTRQFQSGAPYQIAIYSLFLVIYLGSAFAFILHRKNSGLAIHCIVIAALVTCFFTPDLALLSVPFIAAVIGVACFGRGAWSLSVTGAALSGIISLAKFSVFPLAIVCLLMADFCTVRKRQPPLHILMMSVAFCLAFIASGQKASDILPFVTSSLEVSSGYSSAMGINGSIVELTVYIFEAAILMLFVASTWINNRTGLDLFHRSALAAVFFIFIFITFKAGFVRHDLHSLAAWGALTVGFVALTVVLKLGKYLALLMLVASILPAHVMFARTANAPLFYETWTTFKATETQLSLLKTFVFQPSQWLADRESEQLRARTQLSTTAGLDKYTGTIDMIPSDQTLLIALGKNYHPHPTIQEYTSYSSRLIARDKAFFESDEAPQFIVFGPGSIDNRHPASAEGSLWPLFLSRYEPVDEQLDGLILEKRQAPVASMETKESTVNAKVNEIISVPQTDGLVMAKISITPRLFGKALDILYKPPQTLLVVTYDDDSTTAYRLIPEMAREGFLISPLVNSSLDYLSIAMGRTGLPLQRARSFKVVMGKGHELVYDTSIRVDFTQIDVSGLQSMKNDFMERASAKAEGIAPLLLANPMRPPTLMVVPEGLLAHAPTSLRLPVKENSSLSLAFGMRPGAWSNGGESDGACFLVKDGDRVIMERCINPKDVEADRGEQRVTLDIPSGASELTLETACRITCAWGWTYWSQTTLHSKRADP